MTLSPGILGVSAAVLVAAVVAGAGLGAVPPMQQRDARELLPEAPTVAFDYPRQGALPDHYPLITRSGRIEVEDLGAHGLYRQPRYSYRAAYAAYDPDAYQADDGFEADLPESEPAVVLAVQTEPGAASPQPPAADADAPLAPVGPAVAEVTPRTIDVAAELASRQ